MTNKNLGFTIGGILTLLVLAVVHFIYYLVTKGVIYVAFTLFNINWYGNFWAVYLLVFLVGVLLKTTIKVKK